MPFNATQLARMGDYAYETIAAGDPVDQVNYDRPLLQWAMANKQESIFGAGYFVEKVFIDNGANVQDYFGADQVFYNHRDPIRKAKFASGNVHDGFWLDEDELAANGIMMTDDRSAVASGAEKIQLVNLLEVNHKGLKEGILDGLDIRVHMDGSQNANAVPGLDHVVSTTPTLGTVGGINAATAGWWQNNANLAIAPANLLAEMEETWRAVTRFGRRPPTKIFAGQAFIDAYKAAIKADGTTQINFTSGKGGVALDGAVSDLHFHGIPIEWDPTFERLDAMLGAITYPWSKRAYFLRNDSFTLRPVKGRWLVKRRPERLPDRYVHYWATTAAYGITTRQRNGNAVLSVQ